MIWIRGVGLVVLGLGVSSVLAPFIHGGTREKPQPMHACVHDITMIGTYRKFPVNQVCPKVCSTLL